MNVVRQSDGLISPAKSANKGAPEASAEWMEERHPAERNTAQANPPQAQNRDKVGKSGLERVREAARKDGKLKFVSHQSKTKLSKERWARYCKTFTRRILLDSAMASGPEGVSMTRLMR